MPWAAPASSCSGYADSGLHGDRAHPSAFARADVDAAAGRLAAVLREERADVLTIYDANGGYGHPDHVQVHRVGTRAAQLAGTPLVLEATVPATSSAWRCGCCAWLGQALGRSAPLGSATSSRPRPDHPPRPGPCPPRRQAAGARRARQPATCGGTRVLEGLLRLPRPIFALALGTEWFAQQDAAPGTRCHDVFSGVRSA